ncbi:hypothetical protein SEA_YAGO84_39 [Gordonia phage Yago84]|nr:hypothetical protein SEA_YAGO84_39 [Gordonia phage Yago84]QIG58967.1 LamD-like protein [Gordonia phage AnClar]WIC90021.1 helix-turn-helix DNA binding domain protein [Gordonia phage Sisko]
MTVTDTPQTTTEPNPPTYTDNLGLAILARRRYIGLSQQDMADALGMSLHSYKRIETNRRPCPPGLLDTVTALHIEFDKAVEAVIGFWEDDDNPPDSTVYLSADDSPLQQAAVMRAVVEWDSYDGVGLTTTTIIGSNNTD